MVSSPKVAVDIWEIFAEVLVEFNEVVKVGLDRNMGKYWVGKPFVMDLTVKVMPCVGAMHGCIH